ncbi:putative ATP-grasp-modified RiPP [Actinokineospora diospyrosa]|uniref:ATP-grasp target RiPP n=1 Tax=Actinokineospora diospyrosa TaxID=103728 RepID=A0ABT1I8H4_9PSEU|nr:putative ATP-grasp-modified RiPP [Actinokineospora diospyrosa]MCP2268935.1 putative ATP-grasp target RiPP [Actinokineospora diospyrosa]
MITTHAQAPEADPFAPLSGQFALHGSTSVERANDFPTPAGIRPFGLRRATPVRPGTVIPEWTYDSDAQKAVATSGVPLIELPSMGDPTAKTTSSVDGEDPPSSEDWVND